MAVEEFCLDLTYFFKQCENLKGLPFLSILHIQGETFNYANSKGYKDQLNC